MYSSVYMYSTYRCYKLLGMFLGMWNWMGCSWPQPSPSLPSLSHAAIVGHCNLSAVDAADVLQRHALYKRFRGIRHLVNFHPDWPQYSEGTHDNFLTDKDWIQGFGLLEQYQMSFEMSILPHQMKRWADGITLSCTCITLHDISMPNIVWSCSHNLVSASWKASMIL